MAWLAPCFAVLLAAAPALAQAPQAEAYCFAVADSGDNLIFINKDGDGFIDQGSTGTSTIEATAFNPDDGILYATDNDNFGFLDYDDSFDGDGNDSEFVQISADVGTCTLPGGGGLAINDVDGLQFDLTRTDASTGTFVLWATERTGGLDVIFQIDPTTGLVDTTPTPGFTGGATCVRMSGAGTLGDLDDIAIDPTDGTIYAVNNAGGTIDLLVTLDPVTGVATIIGNFFNPLIQVQDMEGLSFGADGQLYGTTGTSNEFFQVEKETAFAIPIVDFNDFSGLGDYEAVSCLTDNLITGTVFYDVDGDGVEEPADGDTGFAGARVLVYLDSDNDGLVDQPWDVIDGRIDFDGDGDVDGADDGFINGIEIIDGRIDLDGSGGIGGGDDGTFYGVRVIDGELDLDADGNEGENNGDDDGTLTGLFCDNPGNSLNLACPITDANGFYDFTVGQGNFVMQVDTSTLPAGHVLSTDNIEEADFAVTDFGQVDPDNDFGFTIPPGAGGLEVTKTSDAGGPIVQGQTITYTINVTNNTGVTHKDVRVIDTLPPGVTYDPQSTTATGPSSQLFQALDEFTAQSYSNDDGRDPWAGPWVENDLDGGGGPLGGEIQILGGELRLTNSTSGNLPDIQRVANLSAYAGGGALLRFDYRTGSGVDTSDSVVVEASNGGPFTVLETYTGFSGVQLATRTLDISGFISATTTIRFRVAAGYTSTNEFFYVDNAEVLAGDNYRDVLDTAAVNRQDGSLLWTTNWLEIGEADGPGSGDTRIGFSDSGRNVMRVQDNDNGGEGWQREADLSMASEAILTFLYRRNGLDNSADYVTIEVSDDGGASWSELARLDGGSGNDSTYVPAALDISAFATANTRIRFLSSPALGGGDRVYFDNIDILVPQVAAATKDNVPAGVNPDLIDGDPPHLVVPSDGYILTDGSTLTVTFRVVVDNPLDPYVSNLLNTVVAISDLGAASASHADPVVSGAVGDRVWLDMDGDGVQDIFEEGIANVEVSLRVDDDGTPGPSAGDSVYASQITDGNGEYLFDQLSPGSYWVDVTDSTVPAGLVQSPGNLDQPTDPFGSLPTYTVVTDEVDLTADFGYTSPAGTAIIGDYVWNDIDRDGIQDLNEVGIGAVTLDLLAPGLDGIFGTGDDPAPVTTTTAADGSYLFTGLAPGEYVVEVTDTGGVLAGSTVTMGPQSEGNDTSDPVTVIAGDVIDSVDFGYAPDACLPRIDFETDALGNPLTAGQVIDDEYAAWGVTVSFTANAPSTGPAMIFDSENPTGGDPDLGSPNQTCLPPGPGVGTEGEMGMPAENCAPVGNILIISEDGDGSDPDDAADGGTLTFTFASPTDIDTLEFLDAENNQDSVEVRGATTDNYRDEFAVASFSNSDGSLDWTSDPWVETNDDAAAGTGSIRMVGGELLLEGTGGNPERIIERPIDLTGATAAVLTYDWRCSGDMESTGGAQDTVHIEISANGGGAWTTLQSKVGEIDMCLEPADADSGSDIFDLSSLIDGDPSDSMIRFRFTISADNEEFYVDNVDVRTPIFYGNLTAPGDNAYELFPVDAAGASELIVTFPASGSLAAIGSCLASIRDKVWLDADGDGLFDLTEEGIEGVTVSLLSDPDGMPGNGDEVVIATAKTDANGNFSFDGLPDGDYVIEITDNDGELSNLGGTTTPAQDGNLAVTIVNNDDVVGINFGYNAPGTVGDRIWNDADGDGVDDPGELGIGGVTVDLIGPGPDGILGNGDDVVLDTTTTASDGSYLFTGVAPGDYMVEVTDTGGVLTSFTQTGDPDATLDDEGTASVAFQGSDLSMDFGYQNAALPDVSGNVFEDLDIDGLDDGPGEPGFEGVTLDLRDSSGNVVATTTTDANGDYSFVNVPAGDYSVAVTDEAGILLGYQLTSGLDEIFITVVATDITGIDFGYVRLPAYASIGDQVWLDADGDGVPGPSEAGLTGVVLELYDAGPDGLRGTADDVLVATTVTDADGRYLFDALGAGNYYVDVIESSLPETTPGDLDETTYPAGVDPSAVIALSEGELFRDADFGYVPDSGTATLGDRVWYDADNDGLQDHGEIGISGVDIQVLGVSGGTSCNPVPCTFTTGPDGIWLATGLLPGDYVVTYVGATLPVGVGTTPTNNGGNDTYNATVADGDIFTHLDFGFVGGTFGSVGDLVWFDTNGDGDVDAGEDGIEGVSVSLIRDTNADGVWDPDGADNIFGTADDESILGTATTDMSGGYLFEGIPRSDIGDGDATDADYLIDVTDIDGALVGLQKTSGTADTNNNSQDDPYDVTLNGATTVLTADFGYTGEGEYGSISNFVWRDLNADGDVDPLEPGIEGVSVELWLDVDGDMMITPGIDNLVRTEVTDANGEYEFKALPFGDYMVDVTDAFGVLSGLTKTTGGSPGSDDNSQVDPYPVTLTSGAPNNETADFGYRADPINSVLTIAGTVFEDEDQDAVFDEGPDEPRVAGATLYLYRDLDGDGMLDPGEPQIASTLSDGSGDYLFTDLPPGDYLVVPDVDGTSVDSFFQTTQSATSGIQPVTLVATNSVDNDFGFWNGGFTTTPVTLAYFEAAYDGSFRWMTSTEVGNLGFNLYVLTDSGLRKLNRELIASPVVDSLSPQTYEFEAKSLGGDTFILEDLDIYGAVRHHGPFYAGEARGTEVNRAKKVDWQPIRAEKVERARQRRSAREPSERLQREGLAGPVTSAVSTGGERPSRGRPGRRSAYPTAELRVDRTGVYRVTYEELVAAGVDLAGARSDWLALTNRAKPVAIHLAAGATFGPGAYFEFVGEQVDSLYTHTNVYRLSVNRRFAERVATRPANGAGAVEPFYLETARLENQAAYHFASPTDDPWYDARVLATSGPAERSVPFGLPDWVPGAAPVAVDVSLFGGTDFPAAPDHHVIVEINGSQVAEALFDGLFVPDLSAEVSDGLLAASGNTMTLKLPHDTGAEVDLVNYDHLKVTYPRAFVAIDDALDFSSAGSEFAVTGLASTDAVAFSRLGDEVTRLEVQLAGVPGAYEARFSGPSGFGGEATDYFVASGGAILSPAIEPARPAADLRARSIDVLVISHGDFIDGLASWVELRESEGLAVKVVDVGDLYARFSHGIVDPEAIRQYVRAAHRWGARYLLLVGGDTYDYFDYLGVGSVSFVPSLYAQTDALITYAPVDPLYGDVDGDLVPDMAVGRWPVRTAAELSNVIAKTLDYSSASGDLTAIMASDGVDLPTGYSFTADSEEMITLLGPDWRVDRIYLDELNVSDAREALITGISEGPSLTSYVGHSSLTVWSFDGLFSSTDVDELANVGEPTVVTQWGCWNTYHVLPTFETLGNRLLLEPDRGAAAVLGAATLTEALSERRLGRRVFERLGRPGTRLGDAITEAKQDLAEQDPNRLDVILGWTLLGDPTLELVADGSE